MLELELTEGALQRNPDEARAVLGGLRNLGVRVVLDDFGTGYSSMSQLRRFAIDGIKIDRSFVRGMTTNPDDRIVVKAMIDMARSPADQHHRRGRRDAGRARPPAQHGLRGVLGAPPRRAGHAERVRAAVAAARQRSRAAAAALIAGVKAAPRDCRRAAAVTSTGSASPARAPRSSSGTSARPRSRASPRSTAGMATAARARG